jgi:hypothetical protein
VNVFEKGVLRKISRRAGGCKTQHYDFSLSNVLDYQSDEDWAEGGIQHAQYEKRGQDFGGEN